MADKTQRRRQNAACQKTKSQRRQNRHWLCSGASLRPRIADD
jgi:hypothetical protein